jgi:hypothetical protein
LKGNLSRVAVFVDEQLPPPGRSAMTIINSTTLDCAQVLRRSSLSRRGAF